MFRTRKLQLFVLAALVAVIVFSFLPAPLAMAEEECPPCEGETDIPVLAPVFPVCEFHALGGTFTGPAPFDIELTNDGTVGDVVWYWGDGTISVGNGANHTYLGSGTFQVTQKITFPGQPAGYYCSHTETVTVLPAPISAVVTPPTVPVVTPEPGISNSCQISGDVGDYSIVICGNENTVTITDDDSTESTTTTTVQPTLTPPAPAQKLTFWQKIVLPWKTFWRGIVTIIEGWFNLNVVP